MKFDKTYSYLKKNNNYFLYFLLSITFFTSLILRSHGFPICDCDEKNWANIIKNIELGIEWPVSGPGYVSTINLIKILTNSSTENSIYFFGIISSVASIFIIGTIYKKDHSKIFIFLITFLFITPYFTQSLFESRPQQLGQFMVFLSSWLLWEYQKKQKPLFLLLFSISLYITAYYHILSHIILIWQSTILIILEKISSDKRKKNKTSLFPVLLIVATSMAVYLVPNGPYSNMLHDIYNSHLYKINDYIIPIFLMIICASYITLRALLFIKNNDYIEKKIEIIKEKIVNRSLIFLFASFLIFIISFSLQAFLLPSSAWSIYNNSIYLFISFQIPNLIFLLFFLHGLTEVTKSIQKLGSNYQFYIYSTISIFLFGLLLLIISLKLLDTNWMLRIISYSLPYVSPLAAIGFLSIVKNHRSTIKILFMLPMIIMSLIYTLKPQEIFSC